ncbi:type VII secretion protein EccB [Mycolicibacter minnesotensis]
MATRQSTRLQLGAQRFVARRLERALRCGQVPGEAAPGGVAVGLGCLLAVVIAAGALVNAVLRPGVGEAPIMLDRATGALYVRVGDMVHPVFNLASARLIAGPTDPRPVDGNAIGRARRGPPLGIPGAPGVLGPALADAQTWSLCEDSAGTTLIAGVDPPQHALLDPQQGLPISSESGATYLVVGGRRVPVGPGALGDVASRQVSALLLNAIPEAQTVAVPAPSGRPGLVPVAAPLCVHWRADAPAGVGLSIGRGLPAGAMPTALAQSDGAGPALDGIYLPPGSIAYVRAVDASGRAGGAGYLIADSGVRFTVDGQDAARSLGLPELAVGVPWSMLAGLPAGPRLSRDLALQTRDVPPGVPPPGR